MYDRLPSEVQNLLKNIIPLDERYTLYFHWDRNILNTKNTCTLSKWNGWFNVVYLDDDCSTHSYARTLEIETALRNALSIFEQKDIKTFYVSIEHSVYEYNHFSNSTHERTNNHHLVAMIDIPPERDDNIT